MRKPSDPNDISVRRSCFPTTFYTRCLCLPGRHFPFFCTSQTCGMEGSKQEHQHPNADLLISATKGFDYLFSNDIEAARKHFQQHDDPFHLMGLGVCAFLEAALGMEVSLLLLEISFLSSSCPPAEIDGGSHTMPFPFRSRYTKADARSEAPRFSIPQSISVWARVGDSERGCGGAVGPNACSQVCMFICCAFAAC